MSSREVIDKIRNLSTQEKRNLTFEALVKIIEPLTSDEIIELSNIIGYPVFTRMCMGVLQHKFVLLQDGAAAIIINEEGKILEFNNENTFNFMLQMKNEGYVDEYGCSTAELSEEKKNEVSHRGKALRAMREVLKKEA